MKFVVLYVKKKKVFCFLCDHNGSGGVVWRAEFISQFSALNADRTLSLSNRSGLISAPDSAGQLISAETSLFLVRQLTINKDAKSEMNQFFTRSQTVSISLFPLPPPFHRLAILVTPTFEFFGRYNKLSEAVLFVLWDRPTQQRFPIHLLALVDWRTNIWQQRWKHGRYRLRRPTGD